MDDEHLAPALRRGDPAVLQDLVTLYGERLLRSAYLLCGDESDAEDLVQDTLIQALRSGHRFRGRSAIYTWLHGILINLVRHHRRKHREVPREHQTFTGAFADDTSPSATDIDAAHAALETALNHLSTPHREVLVLRYYEHLAVREIAERLGISRGTVKSRLHYAIAKLQEWIPADLNPFNSCGTHQMDKQ